MYLVIRGWISYMPSIECIVSWTTHKTLPFCFSTVSITSCLHRKDTRLSLRYIFVFRSGRAWERGYDQCLWQLHSLIPRLFMVSWEWDSSPPYSNSVSYGYSSPTEGIFDAVNAEKSKQEHKDKNALRRKSVGMCCYDVVDPSFNLLSSLYALSYHTYTHTHTHTHHNPHTFLSQLVTILTYRWQTLFYRVMVTRWVQL